MSVAVYLLGLGNFPANFLDLQYQNTKHNLGASLLDKIVWNWQNGQNGQNFSQKIGQSSGQNEEKNQGKNPKNPKNLKNLKNPDLGWQKDRFAQVFEYDLGSFAEESFEFQSSFQSKICCLKLSGFMNQTGQNLAKWLHFHKINHKEFRQKLLVLQDDADQYEGQYKMSYSGSSGGHNGILDLQKLFNSQDFWRLKIGIRPKIVENSKNNLQKDMQNENGKNIFETKSGQNRQSSLRPNSLQFVLKRQSLLDLETVEFLSQFFSTNSCPNLPKFLKTGNFSGWQQEINSSKRR